MNELALFAGAGGGILGGHLLGWRTVCAVEIDEYCRRVLMQRQDDGILKPFPIWDDVRTFEGRPWRGHVDLVSAGFPCQPFSTASRGRVTARSLFSETVRIIQEVAPRYVVLENVGWRAFDGRYHLARVSASCVGAPHRRPRYWLLADADNKGKPASALDAEMACIPEARRVGWWASPPTGVLGMDDGLANRMDRARAIGNGQVPAVVRAAWDAMTMTNERSNADGNQDV